MTRVAFATVGCKVNQYETQVMRERLERAGFEIVSFPSFADVYIINTCSVTAGADRKSIYMIKQALKKNSLAKVIVTGCLVEAQPQIMMQKFPQIRIIKNVDKLKIDRFLLQKSRLNGDFTIRSFSNHDRAFVKVEDGCNQFCTYCRIPYVRGSKIRSRKPEEIIGEIKNLYNTGYREVVLTGVNLALYGRDFDSPFSLTNLLEKIIPSMGKDGRIRLSSLEPHLIPEGLLDLMATSPLICPHLHLSFQSGDDEILKKMGRRYTTSWLKELIDKFRQKVPELGVTGDIIIGFPGERENNFQNTLRFVKEVGFHRLHIFRFSPRPETPAFMMRPKVREGVKRERSKALKELALNLSQNFIYRFVGKALPVLIESKNDPDTGYPVGYTHNYIRVLICGGSKSLDKLRGKISLIEIVRSERGYALGSVLK
ncbi:tRNA (N(6)-L-threonylcarbamoyladenosine(37)-C(2))-methylthiotransferase MtaB [Candidatus Aerophobetes bacterium]|nr:tRNA (N(6)-L-threonylcarbamoyladenosine(37)-C(2))-methylthiotransferase MtaB [Candidatus Aerophobetes bacterium]